MKFQIINQYIVEATDVAEAKKASPVLWLSTSVSEVQSLSLKYPGDMFSLIILWITGERTASCGVCGKRKKQMNEWGWLGCIKNRKQIIEWIQQEAEKRGHVVKSDSVLDLLKAAYREMAK